MAEINKKEENLFNDNVNKIYELINNKNYSTDDLSIIHGLAYNELFDSYNKFFQKKNLQNER